MNKMAALCLIMSAGYFLQAQTIDISGSVTNEHGDAIPGAVVTLDSKNMSDTTDMLGEYTLYRDVTSVKNGNLFYGSKNITLKKN
ncbi:MAG TPA: carboxypeptidase-like regulatory domain-containing protein, partial [Chitinispirillaceae bacterium]|nr:carboxypeptidase-like regulatory domain-containing protein [Chitinispirillaceae bacterium]